MTSARYRLTMNSQNHPHTSPVNGEYGVSFLSTFEKNDHVIKSGLVMNMMTEIWIHIGSGKG